jgi:hypothetical protein
MTCAFTGSLPPSQPAVACWTEGGSGCWRGGAAGLLACMCAAWPRHGAW